MVIDSITIRFLGILKLMFFMLSNQQGLDTLQLRTNNSLRQMMSSLALTFLMLLLAFMRNLLLTKLMIYGLQERVTGGYMFHG